MDDNGIIRILFADDEALFREAVRTALDNEPDLLVIAEAANGCEAVGLVEELAPDVALLSTDLSACDGADAITTILERAPGCRVLVLGRGEDQTALLDDARPAARRPHPPPA